MGRVQLILLQFRRVDATAEGKSGEEFSSVYATALGEKHTFSLQLLHQVEPKQPLTPTLLVLRTSTKFALRARSCKARFMVHNA